MFLPGMCQSEESYGSSNWYVPVSCLWQKPGAIPLGAYMKHYNMSGTLLCAGEKETASGT